MLPTLGVEEEFQVLDAVSGALSSAATAVLRHVHGVAPGEVVQELPLSQVETVTPVCGTLDDVRREVTRLRRAAAAAATRAGCVLVASATPPAGTLAEQATASGERYDPLRAAHGMLAEQQFVAGLHVHVAVPDRDAAVAAMTGTRPWLPVLAALFANGPYWFGVDSGFASYRPVHWGRWPVSGVPPALADAAAYDTLIAELVTSGAVPLPSHAYFDVRPSERWPTLELRVFDVPVGVDGAVTAAGLARGLVLAALADARAGRSGPELTAAQARVATWRAARYGTTGLLVDPHDPRALCPATDVVDGLLDRVRGVLPPGDVEQMEAGVAALRAGGGPAERQRQARTDRGATALVELLRIDRD